MKIEYKFKIGDKVLVGRSKRPYWIHDLKDGEYRVVDSYFDIGDPRSNWTKSSWVKSGQLKAV